MQIGGDAISTKGPRLTCEITFPGRYLVLVPFDNKVSVSTKIKSSEERARLKQTIQSIKPRNCGVIVRTVAEGKRVAELDAEMKVLAARWEQPLRNAQKAQQLPALIYEETSRTVGMLRDVFNPSYENIYVNNEDVFNEVKGYVSIIAPEKADIVKLYRGKLPIFDNFDITRQIKSGFGRTVSYKHGAYLIIEHTEALHVVDVNSGNRTRNKDGQDATALAVNLGAAAESAWLQQLAAHLYPGKPARSFDFVENDAEQQTVLHEMGLLSAKPVLYACNVGEDDLMEGIENNKYVPLVAARAKEEGARYIPICAKTEEDIADYSPEEKKAFLHSLGIPVLDALPGLG